MANQPKNKESGPQGGSVVLDAFFKTSGNLVNADSLPTVTILRPDSTTETTGTATNISTGTYNFTFNIPATASISDEWKVRWNGVVNGISVTNEEFFEVVAAGTIGFGDDITITDDWLGRIKKVLAYPVVSEKMLLTDNDIKDIVIRQALHDYFMKFPYRKRELFDISLTLQQDFPDLTSESKFVFGVLDARVINRFNKSGSNSFLNLVKYNSFSGNSRYGRYGGAYGTRYNFNGSRQSWWGVEQQADTQSNAQTSWVTVDKENRKIEAYSSIGAQLFVEWAIQSFDFSDVRTEYQYDVVKLAQSYLLDHFVETAQIYNDDSTSMEIDHDVLKQRAQELQEEVRTKWDEIPDAILVRPS